MEFIKAEEFLKQPVEVQKVILEWWTPGIGGLISFKVCLNDIDLEDEPVIYALKDEDDKPNKLKDIPLFTEGQLRKFVEDKTESDLEILALITGYSIRLSRKNPEGKNIIKSKLGFDLLQAYWKVALEIAKECVE